MELKVFKQHSGRSRKTEPKLSIYKNGLLVLNNKCAQLMSVTINTQIVFCQNPDVLSDWYIVIQPSKYVDCLSFRNLNTPKNGLGINHRVLADAIRESSGLDTSTTYRMLVGSECEMSIGGEKVVAFPIITKSAK